MTSSSAAHRALAPDEKRARVSRLTDQLVMLLILMPFFSTITEPWWFRNVVSIGVIVLALVIVRLRWNEVGADGRREAALRWYNALLLAVGGGVMWVAFDTGTMMSRAGGVLALGLATLAVFELLRVRRKA